MLPRIMPGATARALASNALAGDRHTATSLPFQVRTTEARLFHASATAKDYRKDVGLGANSPKFMDYAIRNELATDSALSDLRQDEVAAKRYLEARAEITGKPAVGVATMAVESLWPTLGYADRRRLANPRMPYVEYSREAVETAAKRGGVVDFFMGALDIGQHFGGALRVEAAHGKSYQEYVGSVSYREQQNWAIKSQEAVAMQRGDIEALEALARVPRIAQAYITSLELADEIELKPHEHVLFASASGKRLDASIVRKLYTDAMHATRTPESRAQFLASGTFPREAQEAIDAFQAYIDQ